MRTEPYALFVEHLGNAKTGERILLEPLLIKAMTEEEACRTAGAVADFAARMGVSEILIRVVGGDAGRPIGEIRRPRSD